MFEDSLRLNHCKHASAQSLQAKKFVSVSLVCIFWEHQERHPLILPFQFPHPLNRCHTIVLFNTIVYFNEKLAFWDFNGLVALNDDH